MLARSLLDPPRPVRSAFPLRLSGADDRHMATPIGCGREKVKSNQGEQATGKYFGFPKGITLKNQSDLQRGISHILSKSYCFIPEPRFVSEGSWRCLLSPKPNMRECDAIVKNI
jgi:hypothetical protein